MQQRQWFLRPQRHSAVCQHHYSRQQRPNRTTWCQQRRLHRLRGQRTCQVPGRSQVIGTELPVPSNWVACTGLVPLLLINWPVWVCVFQLALQSLLQVHWPGFAQDHGEAGEGYFIGYEKKPKETENEWRRRITIWCTWRHHWQHMILIIRSSSLVHPEERGQPGWWLFLVCYATLFHFLIFY